MNTGAYVASLGSKYKGAKGDFIFASKFYKIAHLKLFVDGKIYTKNLCYDLTSR